MGSIEGVVFTVDGAPLPCVNVTLVGPYGSPKITTMTDGDGRYEVDEIPTGVYDVTMELSGFTTKRQNVEVTSDHPASVKTRLGFTSTERVIIAAAT
jgi:carboxypeptidase family protein